ncbi:uncharacterized protein LOC107760303 [Nicotiana tabacum]|uniref:Uncharacterized protein LOC107760303 n=1 Tax=Nicotiana tabacum TaxID=4097 RepID=A0A1S3X1M5_TOBAC|nr:PREDICTED: uncharacterized protein LOC107760303 [Nicotiana tabacum]
MHLHFCLWRYHLTISMGQSLKKFANDEQKDNVGPMINEFYESHFKNMENWKFDQFCRAVCLTVEDINEKLGSTQFKVPKIEELHRLYDKYHIDKGSKSLTPEEYQNMLKEIILDTKVTGSGAKDVLLYLFGVPVTALFIKQSIIPQAIPNEIFIPGITSATVFLLAKLHKI